MTFVSFGEYQLASPPKTRDYQTLHSNIGEKPNSNEVVEGGNPNIKWQYLVFNYLVKAKTAQHVDSRN